MSDYYSYLRKPADPNKKTPRLVSNSSNGLEVEKSRDDLDTVYLKVYESLIGPMKMVPKIAVSIKDINSDSLDQSSDLILSKIDGIATYEDIIDMSNMSRVDACRILTQLVLDGIIK